MAIYPGIKGKVAIVTGAGKGIGREIALQFAENGAKVVVLGANQSSDVADVAKELVALGAEAISFKCDIADKAEVEQVVQEVLEKFGAIHILVNNAGVYPFAPLTMMPDEMWDKTMKVNLYGLFNMCKAVLPAMMEQKYGKIVNISSTSAMSGSPAMVAYSASKAGIVGFTRTLAVEVAPAGINVNAIAPGPTDSTPGAGIAAFGQERFDQIKNSVPLRRWAENSDQANVVVFLSSDESSYITGQTIIVDGGITSI